MSIQLRAIFENGVFRPLQSVQLPENQEVTVTVDRHESATGDDQALFTLSPERWQVFCDALDAPPREIPALRKLLTEASVLDGEDNSLADPGSARESP